MAKEAGTEEGGGKGKGTVRGGTRETGGKSTGGNADRDREG